MLHSLLILYTLLLPSGLLMYLCQKMCFQHSVLHTLLTTYMHTDTMHIIVKAVSTGMSTRSTKSSNYLVIGGVLLLFTGKHFPGQAAFTKITCRQRFTCAESCLASECASIQLKVQASAQFKCIAVQR